MSNPVDTDKFPSKMQKFYSELADDGKRNLVDLLEREDIISNEDLVEESEEFKYWYWNYGTKPEQTDRLKKVREDFLELSSPYSNSGLKDTIDAFWDNLDEDERPKDLQGVATLAKDLMEYINFPEPDEEFKTGDSSALPYWRDVRRTFVISTPQEDITLLGIALANKANILKPITSDNRGVPLRRIWYTLIKTLQQSAVEGY